MYSFSCFKRTVTFSLFMVFVVGLPLFCSTGLVTYAQDSSHASSARSQKSSVIPACGAWNVVPSPNAGVQNFLDGVAAINTNDGWAVGSYETSSSGPETLTEHWDGTQWSIIPSPNAGVQSSLGGVAAISTNDVWAVGSYETSNYANETLTEHWDGTQWSIIPSPSPVNNDFLRTVSAVSSTDIWAIGASGINPLVEHWDGTSWSVISSPSIGIETDIFGVAAISASNAWIVGRVETEINKKFTYQTFTEHWDGTSWSVISSPNEKKNNVLLGVTVVPATNQLWAVGYYYPSKIFTLTERWNGKKWGVVHSQDFGTKRNLFVGVVAVSAQDVWAVGYYANLGKSYDHPPIPHTLIENWNGTAWNVVPSPSLPSYSFLNAVASVPQSNNLWAVGTQGGQTLIETYC